MTRIAQPMEVAEATGALRHDPAHYAGGGAKADGPIGEAPEHLSAAARPIWAEIVAKSIPGVLTSADALIVEQIANLMAEMRAEPFKFPAAKHGKLAALLAHLGMTPSGRRGVSPPTGANKPAPKAGFDDF